MSKLEERKTENVTEHNELDYSYTHVRALNRQTFSMYTAAEDTAETCPWLTHTHKHTHTYTGLFPSAAFKQYLTQLSPFSYNYQTFSVDKEWLETSNEDSQRWT